MRTNGWRHAALLMGVLSLAACADGPPLVAGNTVDQWNRLDKILPEAPLVNVSYEFEFAGQSTLQKDGADVGQAWRFHGLGRAGQDRSVVIALVNDGDDEAPAQGSTITVGRKRFGSSRLCQTAETDITDTSFADYSEMLTAAEGAWPGDRYIQHFVGQENDDQGRRLEILYLESLSDVGESCSTFDNNDLTEQLRDRAERSFDVVG